MSNQEIRDRSIDDPRVLWASERTLLAWIRTGLSMMGFGFVVAKFGLFLRELQVLGKLEPTMRRTGASIWLGIALVAMGAVVNFFAAWEHRRAARLFAESLDKFAGIRAGIYLAGLLALLGVFMTAYLIWLRG